MRLGLLAMTLVLLLSGCGYYRWSKPGADSAAFDADSAACQGSGGGSQGWETCMKGKGWEYSWF